MEASKLDEIRIYNKALSAETMMTLFQYRGLYAPYVGSWKVTLADEQRTPLLYTIDLSGWTTVTPLQAPSSESAPLVTPNPLICCSLCL